jgi:peptidoglycan/xylan/chitin deacetylase (PgdA/CDA1 family)
MRRHILGAAALTLALVLAGCASGAQQHHDVTPTPTVPVPGVNVGANVKPNVTPLANTGCTSGYVIFTFDDGPGKHTLALLNMLNALHMHAVFFVIGDQAATGQGKALIQAEVASGDVIGDHTWDHHSFTTGISPTSKVATGPLGPAQVRSELLSDADQLVADGAPRPTLWRPPYGQTTAADNAIAASLGLRVVMPYSINATITDDGDWTLASPATIVRYVTRGWSGGAAIHSNSIVASHDGTAGTPNVIAALPAIVIWMNAHHMCAADIVPANATGGLNGTTGTDGTGQ